MKKIIFSIMLIILCTCMLISCDGSDATTTESATTYSITYELNGGTNSENNPAEYKTGDTVSLDFPTKEDYMFAGWYTDSECTNEIDSISGIEGNLTLYAKWLPIDEILEFDLEDGEYTVRKSIKDVATLIIPSTYKGLPVTKVYPGAFFNCKALEKVFISNNLISLAENGSFSTCSSLTDIIVDENNPLYKSVNGVLYSRDGKKLIFYPMAKTEKAFDIPIGTEAIGSGAFAYNTHIETINIPNSVITVGINAFLKCSSLESVTLSNNLESIPYQAFYGCTSLKNITIPKSIKSIGDFAFLGCTSLESIIIPSEVTEVGFCLFSLCYDICVYIEAEERPSGWQESWNGNATTVVWGYKGE